MSYKTVLLLFIMLVGIVLTLIDVTILPNIIVGQQVVNPNGFIGVFGAALFGASLTVLVGTIEEKKSTKKMLVQLISSLGASPIMLSNPAELKRISGIWYHYNCSKRNGGTFWVMTKYEIRPNKYGELEFIAKYRGPDKKMHRYKHTGICKNGDMIIIGEREGKKSTPYIEVWRGLDNYKVEIFAGISFNNTWDGHAGIAACLLSRAPINGFNRYDSEISRIDMDRIWLDVVGARALETFPVLAE